MTAWTEVDEDLILRCERILGEFGRLSTAIPGFVARTPQLELGKAIAKAILNNTTLVSEAGTGTGKTFAYLIPALLSGKKTVISTATKTLQDQLFSKDLPLLIRALGLSIRVQNLKGRMNYLCRYRVEKHTEESRFVAKECASDLLQVREKLSQLTAGERSELPEIKEDAPVWPFVTSTVDNCLGGECPFHATCFLVKARKRAMEADLVIINHHLFFADSHLKEEGFGELLPGAQVVVFDEAHQLAEIAAHFKEQRIGTKQVVELVHNVIKEWPVLDLANHSLKKLSFEIEKDSDQLVLNLKKGEERIAWELLERSPAFKTAWQQLSANLDNFLLAASQATIEKPAPLQAAIKRLQDAKGVMGQFTTPAKANILWVEQFKHSLVCHVTPYDISDLFRGMTAKKDCSYIFTSATLTMASSFQFFLKPLGLEQVETLLLHSPFDYAQQALLYLPRTLPDPKDSRYYPLLVEKALPVINACGGRCFFLFTSHRALKQVAELLNNTLQYPLLVQGSESKPILLARFRELGNAVLLGTATFWEGVDVKGDALSCVIIDKLPFASPMDPVFQGKMAYLKAQGLSGFDEMTLPNAVLALKQGVGRLIRDAEDRGVLMIADPRLTGRNYGRPVFESLPLIRKTRDENKVLDFIKTLALPA